jgi:glycosyltransferase 2 family protein
MARISKKWRTVGRYVGTAVVLVAVGLLFYRALADNWAEVQKQHLSFSWLMVAAVVVFAIAVPVSGLLWGQIVNRLTPGPRAGVRESMAVHSASWLLKYIPGQVGSLVNKVIWGQGKGLSRTLIIITFIYENVFLQLASIVPSMVILLLFLGVAVFEQNPITIALPLLALVPLAVVLIRPVFHRTMALVTRRILKQQLPEEYFLPTSSSLLLLTEFLVPRIINAVGFVFVAQSVIDVDPVLWPVFGAAYVLAGAVGILAVFVPSGLGVREAVIFACLIAAGVPAAQAAIVSILSRLISTVADGVIALIYLSLRASLAKEQNS